MRGKILEDKRQSHINLQSDALVAEGLNKIWGERGGGMKVHMSALPTSRSSYSEHNHPVESQAWHSQQPAFHQAPGQPIPTRTLGSWGASQKCGGLVRSLWRNSSQGPIHYPCHCLGGPGWWIPFPGLGFPTCKRRVSERQASLCPEAWLPNWALLRLPVETAGRDWLPQGLRDRGALKLAFVI